MQNTKPANAKPHSDKVHSEVTTHPAFAVIGVLLGALTSVFAGRLLSIGSADIQGAIGASSDFMTWVQTAYNAATMFIGPITVFLGALLGARRVLLGASVVFMTAEFLSPLMAHNAFAFVLLQAIAGLAAGTYYPLTFTMIIRNFSMKYLHMGIAIYALDILASTHIAHYVESFYVTYLSWHWLFWNALLTTPLMMLAVYFGIPPQPPSPRKAGLDFSGFLYASCAMTLIFIGLDQGERLDWFNSPIIAAFIVTGLSLAAATCISRKLKPNPMLNLGFLLSRDFLLLGAVLVAFRFTILSSTLLVPSFLGALHGYRPEQTAATLSWVSMVALLAAPVAGLILYKVDSRLVCASGFLIIGLTCLFDSGLDPGWTGETFFASQCLLACGLVLGLTGLVASLLRAAMAAGALKNPINILTISVWFQTCRLFGAEIGKTYLSHFLKVQGDLHYAILSAHVDGGWQTIERLNAQAARFSGGADAAGTAVTVMGGALKQQVSLLSFSDGFILIALVCAATIVAISFISYSPPLVSTERR